MFVVINEYWYAVERFSVCVVINDAVERFMLLKGLVFSVVINEYWYAVERFSVCVVINEYWYAVERFCVCVVINEYWYAVERFSVLCGNKWILICCWKVFVW